MTALGGVSFPPGTSAPNVSCIIVAVEQNAFMWFTNLHSDLILAAFSQLTGSRPSVVNNLRATQALAMTAASHCHPLLVK